MISGSSFPVGAAAGCDHKTGNPLREFFAYIPALWNVLSPADIRFL